MIALAIRYWRETLLVVLVVTAVGLFKARDRALVERGRAVERARVADSVLTVAKAAFRRSDTVLVTKLVPAKAAAARVDTLRDSVLVHLTDTLVVKEYIEKEKEAARMCTDALGSCEIFRRDAKATIAALENQLALQPAVTVATRSCTTSNVVWSLLTNGLQFGVQRLAR
jgi:hypothetical protein